MLINLRKRFINTKTKKTASASVESYFEPYCMKPDEGSFSHGRDEYSSESGIIGYRGNQPDGKTWLNHMPAKRIQREIGETIWNDYFKFCVVRNPFDKLVSHFFFVTRHDSLTIDHIDGFRQQLLAGKDLPFDRDKYRIDGEVCMDFFIRYENLKGDIRHVAEQVNVPFAPDRLPTLKSGYRDKSIPVSNFYDAGTIAVVESKFEFELDYFGYSLPQPGQTIIGRLIRTVAVSVVTS